MYPHVIPVLVEWTVFLHRILSQEHFLVHDFAVLFVRNGCPVVDTICCLLPIFLSIVYHIW